MSYILTMTFSGSMMLLLYICLKYITGEKISATWKYRMLKVVIIYYLFPLPFLKRIYVECFHRIVPKELEILYLWREQGLVIYDGRGLYLNETLEDRLWVMGIWFGIAGSIMLLQTAKYLRNKHKLFFYRKYWTENQKKLEQIKTNHGMKRKIHCYECSMEQSAFTLGIFHPTILYTDRENDADSTLMISHEIVHIKQRDIIWKMLMTLVQIIHWFNPVVWWLGKEMEQICEMVCDEIVVLHKTEEEKKQYARLLLKSSAVKEEGGIWKISLSNNGKRVKERMENIMERKKKNNRWNKYLSAAVVTMAVFLNSLTVFAYDDLQYQKVDGRQEDTTEQIEKMLTSDSVFVPDGMEDEEVIFTEQMEYDWQFVDDVGNIYPVEMKESVMATCNHAYVSGQLKYHNKKADGSCTIEYYNAKRCSKCGNITDQTYIMTVEYPMCIH